MVNKEQLEVLKKERAKPKHDRLSWIELASILNRRGPCNKSAILWRAVNMDQIDILINVF